MATSVLKTVSVLLISRLTQMSIRVMTYLPEPLVHCWWWDKEDLVSTIKYLLCLILLFIP